MKRWRSGKRGKTFKKDYGVFVVSRIQKTFLLRQNTIKAINTTEIDRPFNASAHTVHMYVYYVRRFMYVRTYSSYLVQMFLSRSFNGLTSVCLAELHGGGKSHSRVFSQFHLLTFFFLFLFFLNVSYMLAGWLAGSRDKGSFCTVIPSSQV